MDHRSSIRCKDLLLAISGIASCSLACATERYSPVFQHKNQQGTCEVTKAGKVSLSSSLISIHSKMTAEVKHNCCEETEQLKQLKHLS